MKFILADIISTYIYLSVDKCSSVFSLYVRTFDFYLKCLSDFAVYIVVSQCT